MKKREKKMQRPSSKRKARISIVQLRPPTCASKEHINRVPKTISSSPSDETNRMNPNGPTWPPGLFEFVFIVEPPSAPEPIKVIIMPLRLVGKTKELQCILASNKLTIREYTEFFQKAGDLPGG